MSLFFKCKKKVAIIPCLIGAFFAHQNAFADANKNDTYINQYAYIQNPFTGLPSGGGTSKLTESQIADNNFMQQLFTGGTWNIYTLASVSGSFNGAPGPSMSYGASAFAQTGQIAGFSFGGLFNLMNPISTEGRGTPFASQYLSTANQHTPLEAFAEYQYSHYVQVDAGWIGITNSPWLGGNYYNNMTSGMNYQGVLVNVNPLNGLLLTGLVINAAISPGLNHFTQQTLYDPNFDWTMNSNNPGSPYTVAGGASYYTPDNNINARIWAYNFANYANLFYEDDSINFPVNKNFSLQVASQMGTENGNNAINLGTAQGASDVNSDFVGLQGGLKYSTWFGLNLGYNNVWSPVNSLGNGAIVSPYTYNINLDPLYTTSWMQSLVGLGSGGQAYKVAPAFTFLNGNLSISPSYSYFTGSMMPSVNEYDFIVSYSVPQIKGLTFFGVVAYSDAPVGSNQPLANAVNTYSTQLMVSYLY